MYVCTCPSVGVIYLLLLRTNLYVVPHAAVDERYINFDQAAPRACLSIKGHGALFPFRKHLPVFFCANHVPCVSASIIIVVVVMIDDVFIIV